MIDMTAVARIAGRLFDEVENIDAQGEWAGSFAEELREISDNLRSLSASMIAEAGRHYMGRP